MSHLQCLMNVTIELSPKAMVDTGATDLELLIRDMLVDEPNAANNGFVDDDDAAISLLTITNAANDERDSNSGDSTSSSDDSVCFGTPIVVPLTPKPPTSIQPTIPASFSPVSCPWEMPDRFRRQGNAIMDMGSSTPTLIGSVSS